MRQQADRFMTEIERAARLEDAYHAAMRLPPSPYNRLLREGMHFFGELKPGGLKGDGPITAPQATLTTTQLEALRMVLAKEVAAHRGHQRHVARRRGLRAAHHLHDHRADHAGRRGRAAAARRGATARAQGRPGDQPRSRRQDLPRPGAAQLRGLSRHVRRVRADQTALRGVPPGRRTRPLCERGAGARGDPAVWRERRRPGRRAGARRAVRRGQRVPADVGLALAAPLPVHGAAGPFLFAAAGEARRPAPPTYKVRLIAAPAPEEETRKAPEALERPAEEKPAPLPKAKQPPKSTVSAATPPKTADNTKREAAPRTTPKAAPLPGETPSTGSDVATVSTEG